MSMSSTDTGIVGLGRRSLLVTQVSWEADDVVSLRLVDPAGCDLPLWEPGAHLDMLLPKGMVRQYSLCSDPDDQGSYTVAVRRDPQSRGGSRYLHDNQLVGRTIDVIGPRNHFHLVDAPQLCIHRRWHRYHSNPRDGAPRCSPRDSMVPSFRRTLSFIDAVPQ